MPQLDRDESTCWVGERKHRRNKQESILPEGQSGPRCNGQCMESCVVYVPRWDTTYRTVCQTRYRNEPRQRTYTTYRTEHYRIPEIQNYTVQVPEQRLRQYVTYRREAYEETYQHNQLVYVSEQRTRQETRYRPEAFQEAIPQNYTVQVPKQRVRTYTLYKIEAVQQPYDETYTVNVPVKRKTYADQVPC